MPIEDETYLRANAEADEIFGRLAAAVEERLAATEQRQVSVLEVTRQAGLELDERTLAELQIPEYVVVPKFVPWHLTFPWRPIWCYWWHRRYPLYHCCPYWWWRCHWYTVIA